MPAQAYRQTTTSGSRHQRLRMTKVAIEHEVKISEGGRSSAPPKSQYGTIWQSRTILMLHRPPMWRKINRQYILVVATGSEGPRAFDLLPSVHQSGGPPRWVTKGCRHRLRTNRWDRDHRRLTIRDHRSIRKHHRRRCTTISFASSRCRTVDRMSPSKATGAKTSPPPPSSTHPGI